MAFEIDIIPKYGGYFKPPLVVEESFNCIFPYCEQRFLLFFI